MHLVRPRLATLAVLVALVSAGAGGLAGPVAAAGRPISWLTFASRLMVALPGEGGLLDMIVGPSSLSYGSDGRLTVLVLGSDFRVERPQNGERFDAVTIATINPTTKQMAAVNIPRDVGNLPLPDPNDTYQGKVNSLVAHYRRLGFTREQALDQTRATIAYALNIEIDYVVAIRFNGFDALVDTVDGVYMDIPLELHDTRIVDDWTKPKGAKFLAATNVWLGGAQATKCYAMDKPIDWTKVPNCHRALLYVRSRHGTEGDKYNSDFRRAKRQQNFLMAALRRVVGRGSGTELTSLRDAALNQASITNFYTTLPITSDADLLALFNLFSGAQDQPFLQAVLKPDMYAYHVPGTRRYELKLDVVHALTAQWFAPVT